VRAGPCHPMTKAAAVAAAAVAAAASLSLTLTASAQSPRPPQVWTGPVPSSRKEPTTSSPKRTRAPNWPRIYIRDPYVRDAVVRALQGASEWLQAPKCQALLTEFSDRRGLALIERLAELNMSLAEYLSALIVEDGETQAQCGEQGVLAFTVVGSRVILVCGRTFAIAAHRDPPEAQATIVHELLHSLGLGENPPSPREITHRVKKSCW